MEQTNLLDNQFEMGGQVFTFPKGGINKIKTWKDTHLMPIVNQILDLRGLSLDVALVVDEIFWAKSRN